MQPIGPYIKNIRRLFSSGSGWTWVPPAEKAKDILGTNVLSTNTEVVDTREGRLTNTAKKIDVIPGKDLTIAEIETVLKNNRASEINTYDVSNKTNIAQHMIFATGLSSKHLVRLSKNIRASFKERGIKLPESENPKKLAGVNLSQDILVVDLGSTIIKLHTKDAREISSTEDRWKPESDYSLYVA
eukprot:augustus_masked-scaffold_15-processed-gene-7.58-mRNA-1 protein AED:1.00 eAED:1.00 QI:0/-1/0/0/-1/1/1/0/185